MQYLLTLIARIRGVYDWVGFLDAIRAVLESKFGLTAVSSLIAALVGAFTEASGYQIVLMAVCVFLAMNAFFVHQHLKKRKSPLKILFDENDPQFVRPVVTPYGPRGEFFSIAITNTEGKTLYDVTVRALDSWFARAIISVAQGRHSSKTPITLLEKDALHPDVNEFVELLGLDYQSGVSSPDYILNKELQFTLEAMARDSAPTRAIFQYDPNTRPMIRLIKDAPGSPS